VSRISALPVLRYCTGSALVDKQVEDLEFSRTLRGTVFHHYCETGEWGEKFSLLSKDDQEEIQSWKVPFGYDMEDGTATLLYSEAVKEYRVKFKHGPGELEFIPGTLDMFWMVDDLAVVVDIKSNIRAVSDGIDSIQLHGYGHALLHEFSELKGYIQGIYSAMDGTWHLAPKPVVRDSWEQMELEDTMVRAIRQPFQGYHIGTHCSGCWKRARCPAFLIETHEAPTFGAVIAGRATSDEARAALIMRDRMKASLETIDEALKTWVTQHGPIPSEDGKKSWRPHQMPGRTGWDKRKVQALLDKSGATEKDYETQSASYQVFSWKKAEARR
jgi:hypothetical protein